MESISGFVYFMNHLLSLLGIHAQLIDTVHQTVFIRCVDEDIQVIGVITQNIISASTYNNTAFLISNLSDKLCFCVKDLILCCCCSGTKRELHNGIFGGFFLKGTYFLDGNIMLLGNHGHNVSVIILYLENL